jgi:hypothetical protein
MIRSYPLAMVFTVTRMVIPIPPVSRLGVAGIETVVGTVSNIFLDWRSRYQARRCGLIIRSAGLRSD